MFSKGVEESHHIIKHLHPGQRMPPLNDDRSIESIERGRASKYIVSGRLLSAMPYPLSIIQRVLVLACCTSLLGCGPGDEATSELCPEAQISEKGVGFPCSSHDDCAGLDATFCPAAEKDGDWDFCTRSCSAFIPDGDVLSCGATASCIDHGWGPALCAPESCGDSLAMDPIYPDASIPCDVDEAVNELGVGKPCEVHADCVDQPAGKCPQDIHAGLPTWCSMLCDTHSDCGENAFCWRRPSVDGGLVGSCAPIACRIYPDLKTDCVPGLVNLQGLGQACSSNEDCLNKNARSCEKPEESLEFPFCTQDCIHDDDCGANAYCWYNPITKGGSCIPILCTH